MEAPVGWIASGKAPQDYEFGLDGSERHSGTRSAMLRARHARPAGFATLMQEFVPDDYRGRRVRLAGWVKTNAVTGACHLWMRADSAGRMGAAMDNMHDRPITGTTDWRRHEIVLDVPGEATLLAFGISLDGPGTAWLDDVTLETVGLDVPTTNPRPRELPHRPRNLAFEE